jgi:hypothetical protein
MIDCGLISMASKWRRILALSDISGIDKGWRNAAAKVNRLVLKPSPFFTPEDASRFLLPPPL